MKPFVEDGTSPVFGLWSVPDLGYLAVPGRRQARQWRDHRAPKARPSRSRASTATSRTRSARTASSSSGRPSGSTRRTSTTSTSRRPVHVRVRDADTGPRERRAPGALIDLGGCTMERIGFTMRLLPGAEAEYRRRHAAVWPEMLAELRAAGRPDYSIFLRGDDLFGYLEVDDLARSRRTWPRATVNARWQAEMGVADRPADRPGDRVPPPARRGLPPRLNCRGPTAPMRTEPASGVNAGRLSCVVERPRTNGGTHGRPAPDPQDHRPGRARQQEARPRRVGACQPRRCWCRTTWSRRGRPARCSRTSSGSGSSSCRAGRSAATSSSAR